MAYLERSREKILRNCGVPESIIKQFRTYDRADFNSNRRFYCYLNDVGEYIEETEAAERQIEVKTVSDLLNEIENENL